MLKKCPYCDETHYETVDRVDCLEVVLKREGIAYKTLARSYESLRTMYDREHALLAFLVKAILENPGDYQTLLAKIADAQKLLSIDPEKILRGDIPT